jgi:hypothetical protein
MVCLLNSFCNYILYLFVAGSQEKSVSQVGGVGRGMCMGGQGNVGGLRLEQIEKEGAIRSSNSG